MSTFDIQTDTPGLLRHESLNMTLVFNKTGQATGRVSWNIPAPATGCMANTQAYDGIIITIDTNPIHTKKQPNRGTIYEADSNIDNNLFVGSMIGTAKVVGAFYSDLKTTTLDISGLLPDIPYYVSAFPVDSTYRYYIEGIHAYSQDLSNRGTNSTNGHQRLLINHGNGILPTDDTGLLADIDYTFNIQIGLVPAPKGPKNILDCYPTEPTRTITIPANTANTYDELVTQINIQLSLIDNPYHGATAPNTGTIYFDGTHWYTWTGNATQPLIVITQSTQPNNVSVGDYWLIPTTNQLNQFDGVSWNTIPVLTSPFDPLNPIPDISYWIDGTNGYVWDGTIWNKKPTLIQSTDPSISENILPGSYWFNMDTGILYRWDNSFDFWMNTSPIQSNVSPDNIVSGMLWYNETNSKLYTRNIQQSGWDESPNVTISESQPSTPAIGKYWYNPQTHVLQQYNGVIWSIIPLFVSLIDPTIKSPGTLWWDVTAAKVWIWDNRNLVWANVTKLYESGIDPSNAVVLLYGTIWYNNSTNEILIWNSKCFVPVLGYVWSIGILVGQVWFNNQTNNWFILNNSNNWELITPTISTTNPNDLLVGSTGMILWYSPLTLAIQMWNGLAWIPLVYTTILPAPINGSLWFNPVSNIVQRWDGNSWKPYESRCIVEIDCHGNLFFVDSSVGSTSFVYVTDNTLFSALIHGTSYTDPVPGMDEASTTPSYDEIGVGTDGSSNVRLDLAKHIKFELGYPVVDVELTPDQLDFVISKALSELRAKSGLGYKNGYFFMNTIPETQHYLLTNKIGGYNKIVDVLSIQRVNSLANGGHDSGIYGQIFANFLYNAGNFDMLSYHLMTEYKKTYELIFAQRIQFNWNEQSRELFVHQRLPYNMLVAIEATVERTEQDIMTDRLVKPWIQRYATALSRIILAEIRGKYSSLPGPGGSIMLNASELRASAKEELDICLQEIDNFLVDNPAEWGVGASLLYG
jgi:hypothetical protein